MVAARLGVGGGHGRQSFDDVDAPRMGVDVSSHDPLMIARGFGWATVHVNTPDELAAAMRDAFAKGGPQFIRVIVPAV